MTEPQSLVTGDGVEARRPTKRVIVSEHVARRVAALQFALLSGNQRFSGDARRDLAELRRARVDSPVSDFEALLLTVADLPPRLMSDGDTPTAYERAAHASLCLFANHQQSSRSGVHQAGVSLGSAAGRLASQAGDGTKNPGVTRRFKAVAATRNFDDACYHLTALVAMLRSANPPIPLDYGRLAGDLLDLQSPIGAERVQLRWARDFHRPAAESRAMGTAPRQYDPTPTGAPS